MVDVVVVGAGPAGIGVACALQDAGIDDVVVAERERIGASLRRWPREMRTITPSFQANAFGAVDLNAIAPTTSPAFSLDVEHPTGEQWATYLDAAAEHFELDVREGVAVDAVHALGDEHGFALQTTAGRWRARCLVWAAGELGNPRLDGFPGAQLCRPAGTVAAWSDVREQDIVVIGGFESGIDAAVTLVGRRGRRVTVLDPQAPWERRHDDPSVTLTPYTRQRLDGALATGRLELRAVAVVAARRRRGGRVLLECGDGGEIAGAGAPVLAAGYRPLLGPAGALFERDEDGMPLLGEHDESTLAPGLFLAGPGVRHDGLIFCFAYKYRGRFPVVATRVAALLEREPAAELSAWRAAGMHLDDLSCCGDACAC